MVVVVLMYLSNLYSGNSDAGPPGLVVVIIIIVVVVVVSMDQSN